MLDLRPLAILVALGSLLTACSSPEQMVERSVEPAPQPAVVRPDINAPYLDPDLDVDDLAEGFSSESREVFVARDAVTAVLGIEPGDAIADIGAGTGIYVEPFAEAVGPAGTVYAVDISEILVGYLGRYADELGLAQVRPVLGQGATTTLPDASLDIAFTSDVYHHFEEPAAMNAHLFEAIKPGGRYAILDFRRGPNAPAWIGRHVRTDMAGVISEVTAAGFTFDGEVPVQGLRDNYLILFTRPASDGEVGTDE